MDIFTKSLPNYGKGYTLINDQVLVFIKNKEILQSEFKVFLCIIRNLQTGKNASYQTISDDLQLDSSCISKHIKKLNGKILKVQKNYTDKGFACNHYTIL